MGPQGDDRPARGGRGLIVGLGACAVVLALIMGLAGIGGPHEPAAGLARILELLVFAGWGPAAYLLAALGWGRLARPWLRGCADRGVLEAGLGLGVMLTLSHGLGVLGLVGSGLGAVAGAAVIAIGLALLAGGLVAQRERTVRASWWAALWLPAVALLLVAACNPPGMLWASEGRGYDVLSYHGQLAREWVELGRIRPLDHNVYSFLPGYVEAAFAHLRTLMGPGGEWVIACNLLSAGTAVFAAWAVAAAARAALRVSGASQAWPATAIAPVVLSTGWVIVTGSLAYNDLAVVALGGAAMAATMEERLRPALRGALAGALVGFACCAKPTAMLMVAPAVGLVLLVRSVPRAWPVIVAAGSIAGLLTLIPWLARNWACGGNPVFPYASGLFGAGHWSAEQVSRYMGGHRPESPLRAVAALVSSGRGLLHPQWLGFFWVAAALAGLALIRRPRAVAAALAAGVGLQVLAWLFLTHNQSRFLLPFLITACPLMAVGLSRAAERLGRPSAAGIAVLVTAVQWLGALWVFAGQNGGRPNHLLLGGPESLTGELFDGGSAELAEARGIFEDAWASVYANLNLPPGSRLYLLGEARALYYESRPLYNTTWDRWPLGEAMRAAPGEPGAWARALEQRGVTHVLVNYAEIARLRASGWADPLVSEEAARAFLQEHGRPVRSWAGMELYHLSPGAHAP